MTQEQLTDALIEWGAKAMATKSAPLEILISLLGCSVGQAQEMHLTRDQFLEMAKGIWDGAALLPGD